MTDDELTAIEARCNAATPGPWATEEIFEQSGTDIVLGYEVPGEGWPILLASFFGGSDSNDFLSEKNAAANTSFAVHARADVPRLIAEVRRLRAELARSERDCLAVAKQRDDYHDLLDDFAAIVGFDVVGEHSNVNCPWKNALEILRSERTDGDEETEE